MLVVRQEQIAILEQQTRRQLARETVGRLWDSSPFSVQGLLAWEIDERLETALKKADRYGLRDVRDLQAYVRLSFVIGPNFDNYPPFKRILVSVDSPSHLHMTELFLEATGLDWTRAAVVDIVSRSRILNMNGARDEKTGAALYKSSDEDTPSLLLEPLTVKHADPYFRQSSHPDVWRLAGLQPFKLFEECERYIQRMESLSETEGVAIIDRSSGFVGAMFIDHRGASRQLSYWVGRSFWGRGIATNAVQEKLKSLEDESSPSRVLAATYRDNAPSIRVLERCGFRQVVNHTPSQTDTLHFCRDRCT
jgi:[ribosomal protein S5]-alanine N-acetyltransferase